MLLRSQEDVRLTKIKINLRVIDKRMVAFGSLYPKVFAICLWRLDMSCYTPAKPD